MPFATDSVPSVICTPMLPSGLWKTARPLACRRAPSPMDPSERDAQNRRPFAVSSCQPPSCADGVAEERTTPPVMVAVVPSICTATWPEPL